MKTLYLHIGTPKTGTSSIQSFLAENREILKEKGYCYPLSLQRYAHISINRNAHFMIANPLPYEGESVPPTDNPDWTEGLAQVAECFKTCDNVILSDESIWRSFQLSHKTLFPRLMMEAQRQGYGIKVIVYLRRQDEFLLSRWSQSVKHAIAISQPWEAYKKRILKKEPFLFDYAGTLDKLAGYVGKENIIVRRFDRKAWTNGSILEDFMKCVGLEFTGDFKVLEQDENLSLKGNATEIKRIINGESLFTKEDCLYLGNFLRELSPESGKRYPSCMMSQEEIKAFMKKYEAGNARVAEEYIGDEKPLFRDKIKDLPKWQADNPYMIEDVICFFSAVALDLHRENDQLRGEIKELRIQVNNLRSFREKVKHPVRTLLKRTKV